MEDLDIGNYLKGCIEGKNRIDAILNMVEHTAITLTPEKETIRSLLKTVSHNYQTLIERLAILQHVRQMEIEVDSISGQTNLALLRISEFVSLEDVGAYMIGGKDVPQEPSQDLPPIPPIQEET